MKYLGLFFLLENIFELHADAGTISETRRNNNRKSLRICSIVFTSTSCGDLKCGSDSQNIGGQTIYVTVIAFRHLGKGVHYIYHKRREPLINDMIARLFKEAQDSIETAEYLRDNSVEVPLTIDVDYNEDEQFASHRLIPMVKGWILGLGYTMNTKQNIQIASIAADHLL